MAIVICPECQGKISSSATNCVHCGCKITYCPECEAVSIGENDVCPECGYRLEKKQAPTETREEIPVDSSLSIVNAWKNSAPVLSKILRNTWIFIAFFAIVVSFLVASVLVLLLWSPFEIDIDSIENLISDPLKTKKTLSTVKTLLILGAVFFTLASVYSNFGFYAYFSNFVSFLKRKNVTVLPAVEADLRADVNDWNFSELSLRSDALCQTIEGSIYRENILYREKRRNQAFIITLLSLATAILTCVFLVKAAKSYIEDYASYALLSSSGKDGFKFDFKQIENWWLVVISVILYATKKILLHFFEKKRLEAIDKWCVKKFPDGITPYSQKLNQVKAAFERNFKTQRKRPD